eukprot:2835260-Amphidinium_carterae.1
MCKIPQVLSCVGQVELCTSKASDGAVSVTPRKHDQESYCCTCGALTPYECWFPGCECFVCTPCCRLYPDPDVVLLLFVCIMWVNCLRDCLTRLTPVPDRQNDVRKWKLCSEYAGARSDCKSDACLCKLRESENSQNGNLGLAMETNQTGCVAQGIVPPPIRPFGESLAD